jgi:hypothetical protein
MRHNTRHNALRHFPVVLLAVAATASPLLAQQGVRVQSPRRDAGQHALRMIAEEQAQRAARHHEQFAGPSRYATPYRHGSGYHHDHARYGHYPYAYHAPGITIGGSFGDVDAKLHLGGGYYHPRPIFVNRVPYYAFGGSYYRYNDGYRYTNRRQVVQSPTVIVIDRTGVTTNQVEQPQTITPDPASLISPLELGERALFAGDAEQAKEFLTEHVLLNEGDRHAERLLGLALILDDQVELGIAVIARAYRGNPELAFEPLPRETVDALSTWRKLQRTVQRYATVQRTSSTWLAAIVVTQAELPNRTHEERLELARRAGLDIDVADAFQRWLEGGEPIERPEQQTEQTEQAEQAERSDDGSSDGQP